MKDIMKRHGNIYSKICDLDNLKLAHKKAKKDKIHYQSVQKVEADLDNRLLLIQKMLQEKTYKPGRYKISVIEDKGKKRLLHKLPYYPDRIIQWEVMLQIEDILLQTFTSFTCASLKKRGTRYAANLLNKYLKDYHNTKYCLKIDIKKFYPNIDRNILKKMLRRKIKDRDVLWLLDTIIDSMDNINVTNVKVPEEFKEIYFQPGKGIPIGSYLSQYFANFYLSYFDHWLKEELKCKYVVRYMDDIIILDSSKEFLHQVKDKIQQYLQQQLNLELKSNWQIFPVDERGIDFVGYRHFHTHRFLRKKTLKNIKRSLLAFQVRQTYTNWCACVSYFGWLQSSNSYHFFDKYYSQVLPEINRYYNTYLRSSKKKPYEVLSLKRFDKVIGYIVIKKDSDKNQSHLFLSKGFFPSAVAGRQVRSKLLQLSVSDTTSGQHFHRCNFNTLILHSRRISLDFI